MRNKDICSHKNLYSDIYSSSPKSGNNPNVFQLVDGKQRVVGTSTPWNTTQPGKGINYWHICAAQVNLKCIKLSERSRLQRSHRVWLNSCDILEKAKRQGWRTDQWLPGVRGGRRMWLQREEQQKGIGGVMEAVYILTVQVVTRQNEFVKIQT